MDGAFLENYVVSEILKTYWNNGIRPQFSFYRDNNQKEIDLIIENDNKIYPIEIKKTATPSKDDIKNFNVLNNYEKGCIICLVKNTFAINEKVNAVNLNFL